MTQGYGAPYPVTCHRCYKHFPKLQRGDWLKSTAKTATSVNFVSKVGTSEKAATRAAEYLTGIPNWYEATTSDGKIIRHLLDTLHCSDSLQSGKNWDDFYAKHLERCPELEIHLFFENRSKFENLHLFLYKSQGQYWLERESEYPMGEDDYVRHIGGYAVTPQSLHRFLQLFGTLISQAKHGQSNLSLSDYGKYGD